MAGSGAEYTNWMLKIENLEGKKILDLIWSLVAFGRGVRLLSMLPRDIRQLLWSVSSESVPAGPSLSPVEYARDERSS